MNADKPIIGNPTPAMVFTFSLIVVMIWSISSGIVGQDGLLMLGIFQFACLPGYLVGAKTYFERGDTLLGNVFLIFATAFGGISGLGNMAVALAGHFGIAVDNTIYNFPLLWSGLVLVACAVCFRKADLFTFLAFAGGAVILTTSALTGLGVIPPSAVLNGINGVLSIIVAFGVFYTVLVELCALGGVKLPLIHLSKKG